MNEPILEILRQLETEFPGHPVYQIQLGPYTWKVKLEDDGTEVTRTEVKPNLSGYSYR